MSSIESSTTATPAPAVDAETLEFAQQIADQVASFLLALRAIAKENDGGRAISLLLLEISQVLLAGARLGAQQDFTPNDEYQPDVGPEPDLDLMRLRLAEMLDNVDTYSFVFDPYVPEVVESQLSDDLTAIATDLGITELPIDTQKELISQFGEVALKAATLSVIGKLAEEKRAEFATLAEAGDAMALKTFLDREVPDHEEIAKAAVAEEIKRFKEFQAEGTDKRSNK